jgi:hypothetical protein
MRRAEKEVEAAEWLGRMAEAKYSVVAFAQGDNGFPFALPCNLAYFDGALWLHGARAGLKYEALQNDPRVCVTTVFEAELDMDGLTIYFTSLVIYGRAATVPQAQHLEVCQKFGMFFDPSRAAQYAAAYQTSAGALQFIRIEIEHMTAKQMRR